MPSSPDRAPGVGPAARGSRLQLQLHVARGRESLNHQITSQVTGLKGATIAWQSPLAYSAPEAFWEYRDGSFLRALGLGADAAEALRDFWPRNGPQWDGLALLTWPDGRTGELLVEAKANVPELLGGRQTACRATSHGSRQKIERAISATRAAIGATGTLDAWMGPLFQTANRLAHLHFLREVLGRQDAWLVHILFLDDPTHIRTTEAEWNAALALVRDRLGLPDPVPNADHAFIAGLRSPQDGPSPCERRAVGRAQPGPHGVWVGSARPLVLSDDRTESAAHGSARSSSSATLN